jgi:hypothetical protein
MTTKVAKATVKINGPQAVMQSPTQLREQMQSDTEIRAIITEYIKNAMVEGKDYGSIVIKGHTSKPSLFKPGAEKFCGLFKIRPTFKKDIETVEMLGNTPGIIAYICELVDSRGIVIGEGRGTAKTDPKSGSDFDINKQVKIAQKRAQVDAVLRTGGLSDFFTQDMEDAPGDLDKPKSSGFRPMSEKQRKWVVDTAYEVNDQLDESLIDAFIEHVLGWPLDKIPGWKTKDAVDKLKDWSQAQTEQLINAEKPDVVVDLDPNEEINLDDIPF